MLEGNETMTALETVKKLAFREYGQFFLIDPPEYDEEKGWYVSNLRSNYPIFIHDEIDPSNYKVYVLKIENLGWIYLNKDFQIIRKFTTSNEMAISNLETLLKKWRDQIEHIVVSCTGKHLAEINMFRSYFNIVESIIDWINVYDKITKVEIRSIPSSKRDKFLNYIRLLVDIDVLRSDQQGNYLPGNFYVMLKEKVKDDERLKKAIISKLIEEKYLTLTDIFKLKQLEKTISIENVIYLPELTIEGPLHRRKNTILNMYKKYYGRKMDVFSLNQILLRLENSGAIKREEQHYFGQDELRERMIEKRKKLRPLAISPLTSHR